MNVTDKCWVKETKQQREYTVWFYLYEVQIREKWSMVIEIGTLCPWKRAMNSEGHEDFFSTYGNALYCGLSDVYKDIYTC